MTCPKCRGEEPLYRFDNTDLPDGIEFDTSIVRGAILGTKVGTISQHLAGACCEINFCPICGRKMREIN